MQWGKYKTIMIGVILVAISHLTIVYGTLAGGDE
jgi:dipeptide/tripeptide permease